MSFLFEQKTPFFLKGEMAIIENANIIFISSIKQAGLLPDNCFFDKSNRLLDTAAFFEAFRYFFSAFLEVLLFYDPCDRLQNIIFSNRCEPESGPKLFHSSGHRILLRSLREQDKWNAEIQPLRSRIHSAVSNKGIRDLEHRHLIYALIDLDVIRHSIKMIRIGPHRQNHLVICFPQRIDTVSVKLSVLVYRAHRDIDRLLRPLFKGIFDRTDRGTDEMILLRERLRARLKIS